MKAPGEATTRMNPQKIEQFAALLHSHYHPTSERGRKPSPFITEPDGDTRYPVSRSAYIRRLHHFKVLTAVDHGCPCIDPIGETKRLIGCVRRTLWLYLYECLPGFPGKDEHLADLLATHNANLLIQGLEETILSQLQSRNLCDTAFARRILDDTGMMDFATRWFDRKKGRRSASYDTRRD